MSEKFDVAIVGAGPSGLTAAYFLAKAGLEVVVLERGNELGAKSVYGGRIYSHVLQRLFPGFEKEAPVERWVRKERLVFMTENDAVTLEYFKNDELVKSSFTAYLTKFIQWLGKKAEEAGALIATGVRVDSLIMENGFVKGVIAGDEKLSADYTIIAEGANTILLEKMGLKKRTEPHDVALGVKEVIRLDEEKINERFGVDPDEGVASLFVGYASNGAIGGGFLYTMKKEVTLGVVVRLDQPARYKIKMHEIAESFRMHSAIRPLIRDGYMTEYSAHLIVEKGPLKENELYGNGYVVVGDAAGFELNTGIIVRGVDFAMESGKLAADTIIRARENGDTSKNALSHYVNLLRNSFVLKELYAFRKAPRYLSTERIYKVYPTVLCNFFREIFTVDGTPRRLYPSLRKAMKNKVSLFTLIKDGLGAVRSL